MLNGATATALWQIFRREVMRLGPWRKGYSHFLELSDREDDHLRTFEMNSSARRAVVEGHTPTTHAEENSSPTPLKQLGTFVFGGPLSGRQGTHHISNDRSM